MATATIPSPFRPPDPDRLLTVGEVAARFGVSSRTIFRMVRDGRFPPPVRLGRHVSRWFGSDVRHYLDALRERRDAAW
jgi:excisionase family DNA binding protein